MAVIILLWVKNSINLNFICIDGFLLSDITWYSSSFKDSFKSSFDSSGTIPDVTFTKQSDG